MTTLVRDLVESFLRKVKPANAQEIKAVCPFHRKSDGTEEKDPSFYFNVYTGLWFCHSCHTRGNLYTFLRDIGIPREEIKLKYQDVLDEAGKYAPPPPDPLDPVAAVTEPLEESFLGYFDYCPQKLLDEGYPMELLRQFDVGFDWKHSRITFPLRDPAGRLVGISGRATQDGAVPRYKLYDTEYLAFGLAARKTERRSLLWNIHNVNIKRSFLPSRDPLVIVEGYKAALRVAQAGLDVVALSGSHMTQEQWWLLEKVRAPLYFMLDNNMAGRKGQLEACQRIGDTLPSTEVLVVHYEADQPSDLTPAAILEAVRTPQLFNSWFLLIKQHLQDLEHKRTPYGIR